MNRISTTTPLLLASVALALLVLAGSAHARSDNAPTDAAAPEFTGVWHGTIHIDGIPLEGVDKRVMLELREDGSFYCPTHDLVTMTSNSPSVGWATREGDTLLFTMEAETGKQIRTFLFSLVPREERDARVPLKLYLHDASEGMHLHLTPSTEVPAR